MRPLCTCGMKATLKKNSKGYYFGCTFCERQSEEDPDKEVARKHWIKKRKLKGRWYR